MSELCHARVKTNTQSDMAACSDMAASSDVAANLHAPAPIFVPALSIGCQVVGIVNCPFASKLVPLPIQAFNMNGDRETATEFHMALTDIVKPALALVNMLPKDVLSNEQMQQSIRCFRGTQHTPKHQMKVADLGVALGKWTGTNAEKIATRLIKEAFDFKNSMQFNDDACNNDPTGKQMFCNLDVNVMETRHPVNGSVSHFIWTSIFVPTMKRCIFVQENP